MDGAPCGALESTRVPGYSSTVSIAYVSICVAGRIFHGLISAINFMAFCGLNCYRLLYAKAFFMPNRPRPQAPRVGSSCSDTQRSIPKRRFRNGLNLKCLPLKVPHPSSNSHVYVRAVPWPQHPFLHELGCEVFTCRRATNTGARLQQASWRQLIAKLLPCALRAHGIDGLQAAATGASPSTGNIRHHCTHVTTDTRALLPQ